MRPVIGLAGAKMFLPGNTLEPFFYLAQSYVDGVAKAQGIPFILPLMNGSAAPYEEMVRSVDGIILTGGDDPAPHLYREPPLPGLGEVDYERDLAELKLINACVKWKKPVFGVCRGIQILNVALGGTLFQDISTQIPGAYQHKQIGSRRYGCHHVKLEAGFIYDTLGKTEILVNSSHHQSIKDVAPGLRVTASSADGVIEAVESDDQLIIGVQWHPERMWSHDEDMHKLIEAFVALVKKNRLS